MLYPSGLIENLWSILMQIDFIWPRYLEWSNDPYHFISCKYVKPFKLHFFIRIKAQTSTEVLNAFYTLFIALNYPAPDVIQMDNDPAFRWFIERQWCIWRVIRWCCTNWIIPLYNAANSPWNNWSVEWWNSVFDKKLWQKFRFKSVEELDSKLKEFNEAYKTYLIQDYVEIIEKNRDVTDPRKNKTYKSYKQSKLYLLRVVKETYNQCSVEVLNYYINLPPQFKWQFVFIEISLDEKIIKIYQEIENNKKIIYQWTIKLNK